MAKITLSDAATLTDVVSTINTNNSLIEAAIENTVSRDGTSPNTMSADLDLNNNDILNVNELEVTTLVIDGTEVFADGLAAQGDPGTAATITVGTVTTGAAGSSATVTNVGTSSAAILDFTIPRGNTGTAGAGTGDMLAATYDPAGIATQLVGRTSTQTLTNKTVDLASNTLTGTVAQFNTALSSADFYTTGGTDVALADGGTGASLTDPNADRIMFWDDSAGAVTWLTAGTGLSISGTTITATAATTGWQVISASSGSSTAQLDITDLSSYKHLRITGRFIPVTDLQALRMRVSTDNGSTFITTSSYIWLYDYGGDATWTNTGAVGYFNIADTDVGNGANEGVFVTLNIYNLNQATATAFSATGTAIGGTRQGFTSGGHMTTSVAHNAIRFYFGSGNIASYDLLIEGYAA